jgi:hypothetical protein
MGCGDYPPFANQQSYKKNIMSPDANDKGRTAVVEQFKLGRHMSNRFLVTDRVTFSMSVNNQVVKDRTPKILSLLSVHGKILKSTPEKAT